MTQAKADKYQVLGSIDIFSGLPATDRQIIADCALLKTFPKNTVLLNEGDRADFLYVVLSGKAKVFVNDEGGAEAILTILEPGGYFGELALVDHGPRSASVMTLEPSVLAIISKADFERCLLNYPTIALNLIRALTQRVRVLTENVRSLALMDVYGRIVRTLRNLAQEQEGKQVIDHKLTHQDIANMVGASREMVSRIMKDLEAGGYITIKNKKITINDKLPARW
jgi:CRP/FNR family cyclic AMP-dependent transcriptional regulator